LPLEVSLRPEFGRELDGFGNRFQVFCRPAYLFDLI
jgi:hypothetical protein